MKLYVWLTCFAFAVISCKKKNEAPTSLYVVTSDDTAWTTNHVVTYRSVNGEVFIVATNRKNNDRITLRLGEYSDRATTYPIYVRAILVDKNSAQYESAKRLYIADGGKIVVSKIADAGMEGSFDFYDGPTRIQGTFSAYRP